MFKITKEGKVLCEIDPIYSRGAGFIQPDDPNEGLTKLEVGKSYILEEYDKGGSLESRKKIVVIKSDSKEITYKIDLN